LLRCSEAIVYRGHVMRPATPSWGRQTQPKRTGPPYALNLTSSRIQSLSDGPSA